MGTSSLYFAPVSTITAWRISSVHDSPDSDNSVKKYPGYTVMPFSDVSDSIAFRHDIEIASNCTGVCPHGERIRLSIESIVSKLLHIFLPTL